MSAEGIIMEAKGPTLKWNEQKDKVSIQNSAGDVLDITYNQARQLAAQLEYLFTNIYAR